MNPHDVFCPNTDCPARERCGEGTVWIHSRVLPRYRCTVRGKSFGARTGTPFYRRYSNEATITTVLTLLAHADPVAAVVIAFVAAFLTITHIPASPMGQQGDPGCARGQE